MNNYYNSDMSDNSFLYEQAKKGQKKALWKNSLILGILLICYNIYANFSVKPYYLFYYFLKTKKITFSVSTAVDFIRENYESFSTTEFSMLGNAFVTLIALVLILLTARIFFKVSITELFRCRPEGVTLGLKVFPFSMLVNFIFSLITTIITAYFASAGIVIPEADFTVDKPTFIAGFSMFMYMVILAPIIEEVVYRGFVMKLIAPYGKAAAIMLSAFIFGFMHGNLSQFVTAFATGIIFAAVAVETNSILPTVIMHMFNNALSFIAICADDYGSEICTTIYAFLFAAVLLLGIMEVFIFRKIIKKRPCETSLLSSKERNTAIYLNPAMLIYFAYLTYCFVVQIIEAN